MKAKEYNLTATFISSDYDRLDDIKTLTVFSYFSSTYEKN